MAWSTLGEQQGTDRVGAAGDRHGQPDLAQQDKMHRMHLGEPDASTTDEEKSAELPHTEVSL
jgi:Amt family ammonium transporter